MTPKTSRESRMGSNQRSTGEGEGPRQGKAAKQARTARDAREAQRRRRQARRAKTDKPASRIRFGRRSLTMFGAGAAGLVIGYVALASGSITLAPILLVAGYCVFFPMGILMSERPAAQRGGE